MSPLRVSVLLLLIVADLLTLSGEEEALYFSVSETEAILAQEGHRVIIYGWIGETKKSAAGTNYLSFRDGSISLVTFKSDLKQFPEGEPADLYAGQRLAVRGVVSMYRGKPQIKLTDPAQVTRLAAEDVFPPVTAPSADTKDKSAATPPPVVSDAQQTPEPEKRKPPVSASEYFKKPKPVSE